MEMQSNEHQANGHARTMNGRFRVLAIIGSVILVLIVAAIWIPHNIVSRMAHDEATLHLGNHKGTAPPEGGGV
jgi:hypothetical protein